MSLSRRHFFLGSLALPAFAAKKPAPDRPNIVLMVTDYLPQWVLGCYGNKEIQTPNIDHLAKLSVRFKDNMTASPSPAQGRSSLLTGVAPGQSGTPIDKPLAAAGYACNSSDATTAARYIDAAAPGKPIFLTVNLTSPHAANDNIAQKFRDMYSQTPFDTFNPEPVKDVPNVLARLRQYAAGVSAMDAEVGEVLGRVTQKKIQDNTLIILTSTCGALLSHHGIWDASAMYDEAIATPLLMSWPLRLPPSTSRPEIVSSYDLVPTLCDLLTIDRPGANLCGRSYAPLATGKGLPKKERWQSDVFARLDKTFMARGERYKLIVPDGAPGELYDVQADPGERTNQFDNQQFTTVKGNLSAALQGWRQKYAGA
jgi:arylsulfatase A-like enzyme